MKQPQFSILRRHRADLLVFAGLLLVAAVFRLYALDRVPPGLFDDEATNGLDILAVLAGERPIFFEANNGREPLFIYLQAVGVALFGRSAFALRLPAALVGVATVGSLYVLARLWFGPRVAALAGFGLAIAFWHVDLSRLGLRAISAPLLVILMLIGLTWFYRTGSRWAAVGAGLATGLGFYTYLSFRLVPFLLLVIGAVALIRDRAWLRQARRGLALMAAVALVVAAPLAVYFARAPVGLVERTQQTSVFNPAPAIEGERETLLSSTLGTLGGLVVAGDRNPRHNLPGRPVFDPVFGALFLAGLAVATWEIWRGGVFVAWAVGWLAVLMTAGFLTHESPNFLRLSAALPAASLFPALAIDRLIGRLGSRRASAARVAGLAVAGLFAVEAGLTFQAYFGQWSGRADVYWAYRASVTDGLAAVADLEQIGPARLIVTADSDAPILFLRPDRPPAGLYRAPSAVVPFQRGDTGPLIQLADGPSPAAALDPAQLGPGVTIRRGLAPDGRTAFLAWRIEDGDLTRLLDPVPAPPDRFGRSVRLLGARVLSPMTPAGTAGETGEDSPGNGVAAGGALTVLTGWAVEPGAAPIVAPFVHLDDASGYRWAQSDQLAAPQRDWQPGDAFLAVHRIVLPPEMAPGVITLRLGISERPNVVDPTARELGPPVEFGQLRIEPPVEPARSTAPPQASLLPGIDLLEPGSLPAGARPGQDIIVAPLLRLVDPSVAEARLELRLIDGQGRTLAKFDRRPSQAEPPLSAWPAGSAVRVPFRIAIPRDAPGDPLLVRLTTVEPGTGRELGSVDLGALTIEAVPRVFAPPPIDRRVDVTFGQEIRLLGFAQQPDTPQAGQPLRLRLVWQALATPGSNYQLFVHVLDDADRIVTQRDLPVTAGDLPTGQWLPDQVGQTELELLLPPSPPPSQIVLGLYDPTTGQRLPVPDHPDGAWPVTGQ